MKVMIFNTLYFPYRIGGAEVSVQILAEELVNQGHSVRVVSLTEDKKKQVTKLNGVEIIKLPLANVYWPFSKEKKKNLHKAIWHFLDYLNFVMYFRVLKEIKEYTPDVVHTNNISGFSVLIWKAIKKCNVRLIHTSRDYYLFHPNSTLFRNGDNMNLKDRGVVFWSLIKRRYSRYVDEYVGISQFIRDTHQSNLFFNNARSHVIYNAVSEIKGRDTSDIKKIGFIGRLTVEKGFDTFCKIAGKNNKEFTFIAAGDFVNNSETNFLKKSAKENNVLVKGYMKLEDFLDQVDAVILPIKWNEPFGRTVVECVLAGKLVYTNPVGAMKELSLLLPNIIISDNIECDFEQKVKKIKINQIEKILVEQFKPEAIANQYLRVYLGDESI